MAIASSNEMGRAARGDGQIVGRGQLANAVEGGQRRRHILQRQILLDRGEVDARPPRQRAHQRPQLRGEPQAPAPGGVVHGLLAGAIARQQEPPARRVPQGEGEHAAQARQAVEAVLLVEVHDHLGVGARTEPVAAPLEVRAQLAEVVDLPVGDEHERAVLVAERLVPFGAQVDDRQAAMAERDRPGRVEAGGVGAAMRERVHHRAHGRGVVRARVCAIEIAADAAHQPPLRSTTAITAGISTSAVVRHASSPRIAAAPNVRSPSVSAERSEP